MDDSEDALDTWLLDLEDAQMREGLSLNLATCENLGVPEEFLIEWALGVRLTGAQDAPRFDRRDYPSVELNPDRAAEEIDRLTSLGKIFWHPDGLRPAYLDICPTTLIVKSSRLRLVHDWTAVGLNRCLHVPPVSFDTMDTFIRLFRPNCFMAGPDIQDCFLHWPTHNTDRRRLGVRHPVTQ